MVVTLHTSHTPAAGVCGGLAECFDNVLFGDLVDTPLQILSLDPNTLWHPHSLSGLTQSFFNHRMPWERALTSTDPDPHRGVPLAEGLLNGHTPWHSRASERS